MRNLADSPEHADVLKELRQALDQWIAETHDQGAIPEVEDAAEKAEKKAGRKM